MWGAVSRGEVDWTYEHAHDGDGDEELEDPPGDKKDAGDHDGGTTMLV